MNTRTRKAYPSDLTEAQWQLIQPLLPSPHPMGMKGRPTACSFREILNAILYLARTGCPWRYLPHDFPPYTLVSHYYHLWRKNQVLERIHEALRSKIRQHAGKEPTPSVVIIDSQSVKTSEKGDLIPLRKLSVMMRANRSKGVNGISSSIRSA